MAGKAAQTDAYGLILDAIERGAYPPGSRLVESELAERFGVSRTPIREALQRLETQSMLHRASHNSFLMRQLDLVHRSMALLATTSLAAEGRGEDALAEHGRIVEAVAAGDGERAAQAVRNHISRAYETRLRLDAHRLECGELERP